MWHEYIYLIVNVYNIVVLHNLKNDLNIIKKSR